MKVLVLGATGFIGGAVARAAAAAGHAVVAAGRSDAALERLRAEGWEGVRADVADPAGLSELARATDAVVYAVQFDGADAEGEKRALRAIADAQAGADKTLIYTGGVWSYGPTGDAPADENAPLNPPPAGLERPSVERIVLDGCARGVRGIVIRPAYVYGEGKGLPAMWSASARADGRARFVGDGTNRWPMVHAGDLGELYARVLERAPAGAIYNAGDDTAFAVRTMAEAASRGAGKDGATVAWPLEEAVAALGLWARALVMDQRISSARARTELGWKTRASTILDDLERGSYAS